ncbi:MAG TPA: hypothetical protein VHC22_32320 [Pirellulales bacterium]|nr:hypothetical protein [Pirellulales bacterium]
MNWFPRSRYIQQPDPSLSVVRRKVLEAFEAMGLADGHCSEKTLLDDGYVVGRRFCQGGLQAVWLAGEGHIGIFNEAGELIETKTAWRMTGRARCRSSPPFAHLASKRRRIVVHPWRPQQCAQQPRY